MHKFILILTTSLLTFFGIFKNFEEKKPYFSGKMVMCHNETAQSMNHFLDNPDFLNFHPRPKAENFKAMGQNITYKTPDGKTANGYFLKSKKKSKNWLFVYQEWWGLNDNIRNQADIFFKDLGENVNVIALDMYDGKVATDPKDAGAIMRGVVESRLENIVKGAMEYAGKKSKIASVGWCFGGAWSLKSALICGKQNVGAVMYYGMPVRDVERLKTLNCDVLGLFATEKNISKEIIEEFAANMKTAGKKLDYTIYDGAHGFANPSNPKFDEKLAKEAYGKALTFLKSKY